MRKVLQELNLSADQKAQAQKIIDSGVHGKERRDAIMKILTPEQGAKFQALTAEMRQQRSSAPIQP